MVSAEWAASPRQQGRLGRLTTKAAWEDDAGGATEENHAFRVDVAVAADAAERKQ